MTPQSVYNEAAALRAELKSAFKENWQICGYDILAADGRDVNTTSIPRAEVVDVLIDQMRNHQPWSDISVKAKAYWEGLTLEDMTALGNEVMHYEYYGM